MRHNKTRTVSHVAWMLLFGCTQGPVSILMADYIEVSLELI